MNKGGYRIVDFRNVALTTGAAAVTIEGVYEAVANIYGKATLISGLIIDGVHYPDEFGVFELEGSDYKCAVHGTTTIVVSEDDLVKVTE